MDTEETEGDDVCTPCGGICARTPSGIIDARTPRGGVGARTAARSDVPSIKHQCNVVGTLHVGQISGSGSRSRASRL